MKTTINIESWLFYDNAYHTKLSSYDDNISDSDKENGVYSRSNDNHDHDSLRKKGRDLIKEDKKKQKVQRKNLYRPRGIRGN